MKDEDTFPKKKEKWEMEEDNRGFGEGKKE